MKEISHKEVWDTLSMINVNDHVVTKGSRGGFQAKYLSWSWAWETLMKNFPQARFEFTHYDKPDGTMSDVLTYDDGTCQVECTMWIGDVKRTMWLSVMDNSFKAIPNPSSSQINTAKMRCLTKLIAFWGLGFYIYAGEDLPIAESASPPETKETAPRKAVEKPPEKPAKKKLSEAHQKQVDIIRKTVTEHEVFSNGGGVDLRKQVLSVIDGEPTPSQISEWHAYVIGEASMYDNTKKDEEYNGR